MNKFFTIILSTFFLNLQAQVVNYTADFESFLSQTDTFWNGSDLTGGFVEENIYFPNFYQIDTVYGDYWASGWAISNMRNDSIGDYTNLYSSITASGYQSESYAVGQQNAAIKIDPSVFETVSPGFYLTNSTYAHHSMKNGDFFTGPFGGMDGTDPDFFRLKISGYFRGQLLPDSVIFYLADYRFADSTDDYIVDKWEWVDLLPLGYCDSLIFNLSSSKKNEHGYLTPLFFCMDDLKVDVIVGVEEQNKEDLITLFPNPTTGSVNLDFDNSSINVKGIRVMDMLGKVHMVLNEKPRRGSLSLEGLKAGVYTLQIETDEGVLVKKVQKL